eukprot:14612647-Alexandrium_andersonii.AAC.1
MSPASRRISRLATSIGSCRGAAEGSVGPPSKPPGRRLFIPAGTLPVDMPPVSRPERMQPYLTAYFRYLY